MAVGLHFLQNITNVHWEGGLAVIFGAENTDAPPFEESRSNKANRKKAGMIHELSGNVQHAAPGHEEGHYLIMV